MDTKEADIQFDRAACMDLIDRMKDGSAKLKSAPKGFTNDDAIAVLAGVATDCVQYATSLLPKSHMREDSRAGEALVVALDRLLDYNEVQCAKDRAAAKAEFDATLESSILTLESIYSKISGGKHLTDESINNLKAQIAKAFEDPSEPTGGASPLSAAEASTGSEGASGAQEPLLHA